MQKFVAANISYNIYALEYIIIMSTLYHFHVYKSQNLVPTKRVLIQNRRKMCK